VIDLIASFPAEVAETSEPPTDRVASKDKTKRKQRKKKNELLWQPPLEFEEEDVFEDTFLSKQNRNKQVFITFGAYG